MMKLDSTAQILIGRFRVGAQILPMRISGGAARGITLAVPRGNAVRPATDVCVSSVLEFGRKSAGSRFLISSQGAALTDSSGKPRARWVFVEKNAKAMRACAKIFLLFARALVGRQQPESPANGRFECSDGGARRRIGFCRPAYEIILEVSENCFGRLAELLRARSESLVIFEMPARSNSPRQAGFV